jgi:ribonuclease I
MPKVIGYYLVLFESKTVFPYSIHGLWPQFKIWRKSCKAGKKFNIEELTTLEKQLHANWPSSRGTDEDFWKHEWVRHGTCVEMTEVEYFQKALECFEKVKGKGIHWIQTHEVKNGIHALPFTLDWQIGHLNF